MPKIKIMYHRALARKEIVKMWRRVEKVANPSIFQSSVWISAWLDTLSDFDALEGKSNLLEITINNQPAGIGLISENSVKRKIIINTKALFLNSSGTKDYDSITIEHNGFLLCEEYKKEIINTIMNYLYSSVENWEELYIDGISDSKQELLLKDMAELCHLNIKTRDTKKYFYIDLMDIPSNGEDYLASLSSNTRYQIRRSVREYEKTGKITIINAKNQEELEAYFRRMVDIHQKYWEGKNKPGAFGSDFQLLFHKKLIKLLHAEGNLQFLKISCGDEEIGYLYNFIYNRTVYSYQSGFVYGSNAKLKPGMVCHYYAILYNIANSNKRYDFLAGENQYKHSMSTNTATMNWIVLQRPLFKFWMEAMLIKLRDKLRGGAPE